EYPRLLAAARCRVVSTHESCRLDALMDQLERAVARAIEERGPAGANNGKRRRSGFVGGSPVAGVPRDDSDGVGFIHYTTTRVTKVRPRVLANNRIVAHLSGDPIANVFGVLRTQVLRKMRDHKLRTLAFIGPN